MQKNKPVVIPRCKAGYNDRLFHIQKYYLKDGLTYL